MLFTQFANKSQNSLLLRRLVETNIQNGVHVFTIGIAARMVLNKRGAIVQ